MGKTPPFHCGTLTSVRTGSWRIPGWGEGLRIVLVSSPLLRREEPRGLSLLAYPLCPCRPGRRTCRVIPRVALLLTRHVSLVTPAKSHSLGFLVSRMSSRVAVESECTVLGKAGAQLLPRRARSGRAFPARSGRLCSQKCRVLHPHLLLRVISCTQKVPPRRLAGGF